MGSLLRTGLIKTQPAQILLVQVKFTGNPCSYACEWPQLKYTQTRVCRNSYTGTRTVQDSYSCLCERSLTPPSQCAVYNISHIKQQWQRVRVAPDLRGTSSRSHVCTWSTACDCSRHSSQCKPGTSDTATHTNHSHRVSISPPTRTLAGIND